MGDRDWLMERAANASALETILRNWSESALGGLTQGFDAALLVAAAADSARLTRILLDQAVQALSEDIR